MSDLVGNPEDRFSHNEAQFILALALKSIQEKNQNEFEEG